MPYSYDLSISICTYNRSSILEESLVVLLSQIKSSCFNIDLIIIDNNSTDKTKDVVARLGLINCYHREEKAGLSHARNKALTMCKGAYICFLDDDAVLCNDWLDNMISNINKYPYIDFFGGKIISDPDVILPKWFSRNFHMLYSIQDLGDDVITYPHRMGPVGANMVMSRRVVRDNQFDPNLGRVGGNLISGEESDFLKRVGFSSDTSIYMGNVAVVHKFDRERYTKAWAISRFYADGKTAKVMFKSNPSIRSIISPFYQFIKSIKTFEPFFIYCHFIRMIGFIKP